MTRLETEPLTRAWHMALTRTRVVVVVVGRGDLDDESGDTCEKVEDEVSSLGALALLPFHDTRDKRMVPSKVMDATATCAQGTRTN